MQQRGKQITLWSVIILVVVIIVLVYALKDDEKLDEETANCISENSKIFVSRTCGNCAEQKRILGDHYDLFDTIDCIDKENAPACMENKITGYPTWFINNQRYDGTILSVKELKELTGC